MKLHKIEKILNHTEGVSNAKKQCLPPQYFESWITLFNELIFAKSRNIRISALLLWLLRSNGARVLLIFLS